MIKTHAFMRAAAALLAASTALASTSLAAQTSTVAVAPAKARLGAWGVDLTSRDPSVKPGDDFQKYASGSWLAKTQIAADCARARGLFDRLSL